MNKKYIVSLLEEGEDKKLNTNTLELTDRELNDMMSRAGFYLDKEFGYTDHTDYFQFRMVFRYSIRHPKRATIRDTDLALEDCTLKKLIG